MELACLLENVTRMFDLNNDFILYIFVYVAYCEFYVKYCVGNI